MLGVVFVSLVSGGFGEDGMDADFTSRRIREGRSLGEDGIGGQNGLESGEAARRSRVLQPYRAEYTGDTFIK